ncbi:MAG: nickel-dependent lactate racemase [Candidatus Nezhaarchaeota archaeon]|nr:nickel-dependent lactate racemase [Candidatus Nezhaarchaeota archaeon]
MRYVALELEGVILVMGLLESSRFLEEWLSEIEAVKRRYGGNVVYEVAPRDVPGVDDVVRAVVEAVRDPIGSRPLREIAKPGMNVVVVVDDITRATPRDRIVPVLLNELNYAGIPDSRIKVVIALGTHRYLTKEEIVKCVGLDVVRRVEVFNHEWMDSRKLVYVGDTASGIPVYVNKLVYEADLVIGVGCIVPHLCSGYGGGAKIIQPGVCGEVTTARTHVLAALIGPERLLGDPDNVVRREMEDVAEVVGLDFIVNVVLNRGGEVVKVVAGDMRAAFREGVKVAEGIYRRGIPELVDIVIVNSYPALIDYWQAMKGLVHAQFGVRHGGIVILYTDCPDGISPTHHKVFEKYSERSIEEVERVLREGREEDLVGLSGLFMHKRCLARSKCICVSKRLSIEEKRILGFKHADGVLEALQTSIAEHGLDAKVGIIHHGGEVYPYLMS